LSALKFVFAHSAGLSLEKKNEDGPCMLKKNLSIILVVLLALLLIALVIWRFDKKIKNIDQKIKQPVAYLDKNTKRS
jgi:uncharacterized membrane protein YidH (DUF202 family)